MVRKLRGRPAGKCGQAPVLNPDEIKRVLKIAQSRARFSSRSEAALFISIYLGLRAKEMASLKWGDVFESDGRVKELLRLQSAYTKGSKLRDLYLTAPKLRQALAKYGGSFEFWKKPEAPLFKSQKQGHMKPASMARFLKTLFIEAGLPNASSHTGRRTFITSLAERGIDMKAISVLAGHSNIRTTALYVDASPQKLSRILSDVAW